MRSEEGEWGGRGVTTNETIKIDTPYLQVVMNAVDN